MWSKMHGHLSFTSCGFGVVLEVWAKPIIFDLMENLIVQHKMKFQILVNLVAQFGEAVWCFSMTVPQSTGKIHEKNDTVAGLVS